MNYKKDLEGFKKFLESYEFHQLEINETNDGILMCDGEVVKDNNGYKGESEKWINVGYSLRGMFPKLLSNLFPYDFEFNGIKMHSIEGFFQGI